MKHHLFLLLFLGFQIVAYSQTVRTICSMPTALNENSGMLISSSNGVWFHNDSGDSAKLYLMDTLGVIQRTILIQNVSHVDWEDITKDNQGNVYIGDFGNNGNTRQNLMIYKIPHPDNIVGSSVNAEIIYYHYPEQLAFPPPDSLKKYDTEGLIYWNDSLYIFTKDRTSPHLGYTWLYQIPADTGSYAAILLDSFHTNQINYIFEVTAAAISPNGRQLALLGANRIWLFRGFEGSRFFDGTVQTIMLNGISQKEGLDFVDNHHLYFSNETSFLGAAHLGEIILTTSIVGMPLEHEEEEFIEGIMVYPNPAQGHLSVQFNLKKALKLSISLLNQEGKRVQLFQNKKLEAGIQALEFSLEDLAAGVYILRLNGGGQRYSKRVRIGE